MPLNDWLYLFQIDGSFRSTYERDYGDGLPSYLYETYYDWGTRSEVRLHTMKRIFAAVASLMAMTAAVPTAAGADANCFPIPHAEEIVTLVEPRNTAIFDPRGIWMEFSVAPFGEDIRRLFELSATAVPLSGGSPPQRLAVETPYRLSGDTLGGPASPTAALWIAHISNPKVASRVTVSYGINLWQTPAGAPCEGPLSVRRIGDFLWVPTNGVGPFGQKPPLP